MNDLGRRRFLAGAASAGTALGISLWCKRGARAQTPLVLGSGTHRYDWV